MFLPGFRFAATQPAALIFPARLKRTHNYMTDNRIANFSRRFLSLLIRSLLFVSLFLIIIFSVFAFYITYHLNSDYLNFQLRGNITACNDAKEAAIIIDGFIREHHRVPKSSLAKSPDGYYLIIHTTGRTEYAKCTSKIFPSANTTPPFVVIKDSEFLCVGSKLSGGSYYVSSVKHNAMDSMTIGARTPSGVRIATFHLLPAMWNSHTLSRMAMIIFFGLLGWVNAAGRSPYPNYPRRYTFLDIENSTLS
jgi:hypothetical protein